MKSKYLYLLSEWENFLKVAEKYVDQSNRERKEIKELKDAREALDESQFSLQEAESQIKVTNHFREHEDKVRQEFF